MIDFLLIIFCLFCVTRGILRGPVIEAFSIAGIISGLMVASAYYSRISFFIFSWLNNIQIRNLCGFLLFFCFIVLVANFLAVIGTYVFHINVSGVGSRLAGAVMGTLKAILLISALLVPLVAFSPKDSGYIENSSVFSIESTLSKEMAIVIPEDMQKKFSNNIVGYTKKWSHQYKSNT